MKAYLCSIRQPTTQLCREQLERFGFRVIMLDEQESWEDKYKRFIMTADESCIRIDADVIPNKHIRVLTRNVWRIPMKQAYGYDFYKNDIGIIGAVYYSKQALEVIRQNLDKIDWRRPEATAWRLEAFKGITETSETVIGIHGFFQNELDLERHEQHKIERKQIEDFDFDLARKMMKL